MIGAQDPLAIAQQLSKQLDCLRYLTQMKHTIRTVGQLQPESVSPKAQEELLQVFRAWKQR